MSHRLNFWLNHWQGYDIKVFLARPCLTVVTWCHQLVSPSDFLRYFVTWHLTRIFNSQNTGQGLTGTLKYALLYAKWSIRTLKHKKKTWSKTTDMSDSLFMTQLNWTFWKTDKNRLPSGWTVAQLKCTVRQTGYPTYGFSICYSSTHLKPF